MNELNLKRHTRLTKAKGHIPGIDTNMRRSEKFTDTFFVFTRTVLRNFTKRDLIDICQQFQKKVSLHGIEIKF